VVRDVCNRWIQLDEDARAKELQQVERLFSALAGPRRVRSLSVRIWFASLVNRAICLASARDAAKAFRDGGPYGLREWNEKVWPELVKEVRTTFAPVHEKLVEELYKEVQANPIIDDGTKTNVRRLYRDYKRLERWLSDSTRRR
jgi:hypothetical protein